VVVHKVQELVDQVIILNVKLQGIHIFMNLELYQWHTQEKILEDLSSL
jgi:hypothetical protein